MAPLDIPVRMAKKAKREREREGNKRKERDEGVENKSTTDRVTNCSTEIETKLLKRPFEHYPFDFPRVYGNTR